MVLLAFIALYISMSVLSVHIWCKYIAWKWKEDWTSLSYDEVFDDSFMLIASANVILWPITLPMTLIMWAAERI